MYRCELVSDGENPLLNAGEEAVLQDWREKGGPMSQLTKGSPWPDVGVSWSDVD